MLLHPSAVYAPRLPALCVGASVGPTFLLRAGESPSGEANILVKKVFNHCWLWSNTPTIDRYLRFCPPPTCCGHAYEQGVLTSYWLGVLRAPHLNPVRDGRKRPAVAILLYNPQVKVLWCCYRAKASHYNRITPFCCEARQRGEERQVGGDNTNEGGQKALHPLRSIKRELGWSRRRGDYCGSIPFLFLASIGCVRQEEAEYGGEEQQRGRGAVAPRRRDEPAGGRVQGHGGGVRPQIPPPWAQGKPVQLLRRQAHQSPRPPRNLAFFLLWFRNRRSAGVSFASFILFRVLFSANAKK